jgi:hypothetical protein
MMALSPGGNSRTDNSQCMRVDCLRKQRRESTTNIGETRMCSSDVKGGAGVTAVAGPTRLRPCGHDMRELLAENCGPM